MMMIDKGISMGSIRKLHCLVLVCLLLCLMGCSSPPVKFGISSGQNLNPNEEKKPLPVVVRFYLLSEDQAFNGATFEELWKDDIAALGKSLVSRQELVLTPGTEERLVMDRKEDAMFAGVMAIFREASDGQWRVIKPLPDNYVSKRFSKTLRVTLNGNIVEIE